MPPLAWLMLGWVPRSPFGTSTFAAEPSPHQQSLRDYEFPHSGGLSDFYFEYFEPSAHRISFRAWPVCQIVFRPFAVRKSRSHCPASEELTGLPPLHHFIFSTALHHRPVQDHERPHQALSPGAQPSESPLAGVILKILHRGNRPHSC